MKAINEYDLETGNNCYAAFKSIKYTLLYNFKRFLDIDIDEHLLEAMMTYREDKE